MAENAQQHGMAMEKKIADAQITDQKLGKWLGFSSLIFVILLSFIAGMTGNNLLSGILLGVGVLGVVGRFITQRAAEK